MQTLTERFPPFDLDWLSRRLDQLRTADRDEKIKFLAELVARHPQLSVVWGEGSRYRRVRKFGPDLRPSNLSELLWPPKSTAFSGRANFSNDPLLYLSHGVDTALAEARVEDEWVALTTISFRRGASVRLAPAGEILHVHRRGRGLLLGDVSEGITGMLNASDRNAARSLLLADAYLFESFAQTEGDYDLTARVAGMMFEKDSKLDGVVFPSLAHYGGLNFALKTDKFHRNFFVEAVSFGRAQSLGHGFFVMTDISCVVETGAQGELFWDEGGHPDGTTVLLSPA